MKKVLFIHQNFPGQFRHIASYMAKQPEYDIRAICRERAPGLKGVSVHRYKPHREASRQTHPYARTFEQAVLHGQQVLRVLLDWRAKGYRPDVIVAHPGWGETLYAKQAYPDVPLIHFCEYYYHPTGADADFDPEFPLTEHRAASIESRNALHLLNLEHCDVGIVPTKWQYALHPKAYQHKLRVIHEGVDIENLGPDPNAKLVLPNGHTLYAGDPVVTYVARNLEPYRGFHQFMRALPRVLEKSSDCHVVVVGGDGVSYGSKPDDAPNWRTKLLREIPVDTSRVHFIGRVKYEIYKKTLQISKVHVYLTYPFVLSWSMLEAMACGCYVVGSDTAPVREVVNSDDNGMLVDLFSPEEISKAIIAAISRKNETAEVGRRALLNVVKYSSKKGVDEYLTVIQSVTSGDGQDRRRTEVRMAVSSEFIGGGWAIASPSTR